MSPTKNKIEQKVFVGIRLSLGFEIDFNFANILQNIV